MSFYRKVLVVGGGIGGLAVTRGFLQQGAEVTVVERAPAFTPAGAGILLAANAIAVLDALGVEVASRGQALAGMSIANARGALLQAARADELRAAYQTLYALHRKDLHEALLEGAAGASLRMGCSVRALAEEEESVSVVFTDGTSGSFDLVIGADGIHSRVRTLLYHDDAPGTVYSGYTCWRFVAPSSEPLEGAVEMFGRGDRAGIVPLTEGRAYVFLVANAPEGAPGATYEELKARFSRFPPVVSSLLQSAEASGAPLLHHDLHDAERIVWGRGRVWLLGDAAHAPLPNLGQGAAMALEDALALSRCLGTAQSASEAFEQYVTLRHKRALSIWRGSRRLGWIGQWSGAFTTRVR